MNLKFSDYKERGLYIIFQDSSGLELTRDNIERVATKFWEDPLRIPPEVKRAADFQLCPICPFEGQKRLCYALRPVLPFLEVVDKYLSFDKVTAIYKRGEKEILHIADTTMQDALKYVSILSLVYYCQTARKYWKYFYGVIPIMDAKEVATRLYLNIYWLHNGEKEGIDRFISKFKEEMTISSQAQVKRLNLICKKDAFMNAFVATQVATEFLTMDMDKILEVSFGNFEKGRD